MARTAQQKADAFALAYGGRGTERTITLRTALAAADALERTMRAAHRHQALNGTKPLPPDQDEHLQAWREITNQLGEKRRTVGISCTTDPTSQQIADATDLAETLIRWWLARHPQDRTGSWIIPAPVRSVATAVESLTSVGAETARAVTICALTRNGLAPITSTCGPHTEPWPA